ncbi:hypothetical protein EB74_28080 [Mycobacterium sp. SWH-M5]|nr:hypothetical protein EB74_28080 [Mycobacterium sp. SWH-M5]
MKGRQDLRMPQISPSGESADILLSLPIELKDRMVNTIAWTRPYTGICHQQRFIRKAIADLCDRLEDEFNAGEAFDPVATPAE